MRSAKPPLFLWRHLRCGFPSPSIPHSLLLCVSLALCLFIHCLCFLQPSSVLCTSLSDSECFYQRHPATIHLPRGHVWEWICVIVKTKVEELQCSLLVFWHHPNITTAVMSEYQSTFRWVGIRFLLPPVGQHVHNLEGGWSNQFNTEYTKTFEIDYSRTTWIKLYNCLRKDFLKCNSLDFCSYSVLPDIFDDRHVTILDNLSY